MPLVAIYAAAALLFIGAFPLPYGFYMVLRVVGCGIFIWAAIVASGRHAKTLPWVYGGLAVIFNPLIKVHLPKEAWAAVDVAAAVLLLVTAKHIKTTAAIPPAATPEA